MHLNRSIFNSKYVDSVFNCTDVSRFNVILKLYYLIVPSVVLSKHLIYDLNHGRSQK